MKSLDKLLDFTLITSDGYYGQIADILIDLTEWKAKYFKVDFGGILSSEFQMVSSEFVKDINFDKKELYARIEKDNIHTKSEGKSAFEFHQFKGFHIFGEKVAIGTLEDFYVDNEWNITYATVDIQNGLPWSNLKPIEVKLFHQINHHSREISTDLNAETLKDAPSYSLSELEDTINERALHDFYSKS